jgi:hypothetical protein
MRDVLRHDRNRTTTVFDRTPRRNCTVFGRVQRQSWAGGYDRNCTPVPCLIKKIL